MALQIKITRQYKADMERIAKADGIQRGVFFDTSGNMRSERVRKSAQYPYVYKTRNGQPISWNKVITERQLPSAHRPALGQ